MKPVAPFLQSTRLFLQIRERVRCPHYSFKTINIASIELSFEYIDIFKFIKADRPRQTSGSPPTGHGHGKPADTAAAGGEH